MTVRNEPLDSGDRWINCDFQVPEGLGPDQMNAIGGTLMAALLDAEWCEDPSVSTYCGGDPATRKTPPGGDFSFVIKKDYVFPPAPGKPDDN